MPIVRESKYLTPYLVYDAPVNDATLELRKKFDVDPETGYPRHYNWRPLAKLGPEYRPEEAFEKLLPYRPEAMYTSYLTLALSSLVLPACTQALYNIYKGRALFSKPHVMLASFVLIGATSTIFALESPKRQAMENAVYIDYIKSHPERFETVKRRKCREVLHTLDIAREAPYH